MKIYVALFFALSILSCANSQKGTKVIIHTSLGDMTAILYDETPLHRDNFVKHANAHFYDSLLFHRVINGFMIQGGDPTSKNAPEGQMLGSGGNETTLPAEIKFPQFYHKKGAIAAARQSDQVNPERRSSGSQFYIVQGNKMNEAELNMAEQNLLGQKRQEAGTVVFQTYVDSLKYYQSTNDSIRFSKLYNNAVSKANAAAMAVDSFKLDPALKANYQTIGGTPSLDGTYTVFGEVIDGLEIIDKIAAVSVDGNSRPFQDIKMWVEVVK